MVDETIDELVEVSDAELSVHPPADPEIEGTEGYRDETEEE
jgi:hypothetical protein